MLNDAEFIRFPTKLLFDKTILEKGQFATAFKNENTSEYIIYIHPYFKKQLDVIPALVLYHLVVVNYGDFANYEDAEIFASTVLNMDQEEYYQYICNLTDQIP